MNQKGLYGEQLAAEYLKKQGCQILEKNFRCKYGEIDLIIKDQDYLVIVEVKSRSSRKKGAPAEAVTWTKQRRIISCFHYYRMLHQLPDWIPVRFDVISCEGKNQIQWIQNAFEYFE